MNNFLPTWLIGFKIYLRILALGFLYIFFGSILLNIFLDYLPYDKNMTIAVFTIWSIIHIPFISGCIIYYKNKAEKNEKFNIFKVWASGGVIMLQTLVMTLALSLPVKILIIIFPKEWSIYLYVGIIVLINPLLALYVSKLTKFTKSER